MRYLYSFLFYLAVPFILLRLCWRARKAKAYAQRWHERFAYINVPVQWQNGLWIHTVSVGEVLAAVPIVKAIFREYPALPIIMTTMTPTGSACVTADFVDNVFHVYVPYDLPGVVNRFLNRTKPRAIMILETELWPNILHQCRKRDIPLMMANARLSERSFNAYAKFPRTIKKMLNAVTVLAAHAKQDAQYFIQLGISEDKVSVTGSIKFEINVSASTIEQAQVLRNQLGQNRPIWIAASTHTGEDEKVLAAHKHVLKVIPNALLILTPRHPERFTTVYELAKKRAFNTVRRSANESCSVNSQVFIGDTMGELMLFFAAVDLAFIGGSLVNSGGHNILEPASLGVASIIGPYYFNFKAITEMMLAVDGVRLVNNSEMLAQQVIRLLQNSSERSEIGERARYVVEQNRGALQKHLDLLRLFSL